jgi:hypothetical protein
LVNANDLLLAFGNSHSGLARFTSCLRNRLSPCQGGEILVTLTVLSLGGSYHQLQGMMNKKSKSIQEYWF